VYDVTAGDEPAARHVQYGTRNAATGASVARENAPDRRHLPLPVDVWTVSSGRSRGETSRDGSLRTVDDGGGDASRPRRPNALISPASDANDAAAAAAASVSRCRRPDSSGAACGGAVSLRGRRMSIDRIVCCAEQGRRPRAAAPTYNRAVSTFVTDRIIITSLRLARLWLAWTHGGGTFSR